MQHCLENGMVSFNERLNRYMVFTIMSLMSRYAICCVVALLVCFSVCGEEGELDWELLGKY